jgi:hypothetical protein
MFREKFSDLVPAVLAPAVDGSNYLELVPSVAMM